MKSSLKKQLKEKLFSMKQLAVLRLKKENPVPLKTDATKKMVLIGPTNSAGQGYAWARSLERNATGVEAVSMATMTGAKKFNFRVDQAVNSGFVAHSKKWQKQQFETVLHTYKGVLIESARSPFGGHLRGDLKRQLALLQNKNLRLGLIFHGSDLRDPDTHMAAEENSYFKTDPNFTKQMREQVQRSQQLVNETELPVFVSTPDLLQEINHAQWLPVVVDIESWKQPYKPLKHGGKLRVAHAPSQSFIKGSDVIDPVLTELDRSGIIDYRRANNLNHSEMRQLYGETDVVVDQMRGGPYGVAAVEAMAAGRIVVSYVPRPVRQKVLALTGETLPIVQADPETLERVILEIVHKPENALETATAGTEFVWQNHSGTRSGKILADWMHTKTEPKR